VHYIANATHVDVLHVEVSLQHIALVDHHYSSAAQSVCPDNLAEVFHSNQPLKLTMEILPLLSLSGLIALLKSLIPVYPRS